MANNELKQLDTRQQCREKLPIWFGSRSNHYHGLLEVMMNANDEMYTHSSVPFAMKVRLLPDGQTIAVKDYGRGIKLTDKYDDRFMYELLFETLFAGTNFDNAEVGKETTGTNGCGLTVLNNTSQYFEAVSEVDGILYSVKYTDGGLNREVSKREAGRKGPNGTTFWFKLDPDMYTQTTFDIEVIKEMCNHLAGISTGLLITLECNYGVEEYQYLTMADYMEKNCSTTIGTQYEFEERTESEEVIGKEGKPIVENNRMKLLWSIGTDPFQETFLNCTYLREEGSIYDGVIDGFRKVLDKYSDNKVKITAADVELGLNFVCGLWTNNVEFANQTKFSTKKLTYKKHVSKYVVDNLEAFRLENAKAFNEIIKHFVEINNFNKKAEDDIKQLKSKIQKKTKGGLSPKVEGLIDCNMRTSNVEDRILIIDEGKSANSTIIDSRDPDYMGCIGLRGRFINSFKTSAINVFKNQEALAIMTALGCGIELPEKDRKRLKDTVAFNKEDLRYGKIALITDADGFGKAITLSLLCFFYKFYPTLCEEGRIYVVSSPRYVLIDKKDNPHYAYNDKEKDEVVKELGKNLSHIGIVKGLGELDQDVFWEYVLSPEAREKTFTQVKFDGNQKEIERMLEITMGEEIEERKKYIMKHVVEANVS